MKVLIFCFMSMSVTSLLCAQDTTSSSPLPKRYTLNILPRVHSIGHFPFSGSYINHHTSADLNVSYETKKYGVFIFKSIDIEDLRSIVNYLQVGISKKFSITQGISVTPYAGYIFSQTDGFADQYSDYFASVVIGYKVNEFIQLENVSLFADFGKPELYASLNNRLLANILVKQFRFDVYLWYRQALEGAYFDSLAGSMAINFPRIKLAGKVGFKTTIAMQGFLVGEKPEYAMKRGFLFTLSFPIEISQ